MNILRCFSSAQQERTRPILAPSISQLGAQTQSFDGMKLSSAQKQTKRRYVETISAVTQLLKWRPILIIMFILISDKCEAKQVDS